MSYLDILAQDKNIIIYRKELNAITGSVTATILLQQLIYWSTRNNHKPFYKFIAPCLNEKYNEGDSWIEELGFTKKEFVGAYQKLEDLNLVYKKINMSRVTFYTLNIEILSKLLFVTYGSDKKKSIEVTKSDIDNDISFDTETTTENIIKNKQKKESSLNNQIDQKLSKYKNINLDAFNEWISRKNYKDIAPIIKILNMLSKYSHEDQQKIVDNSIMNGWAGLFDLKHTQSNNTQSFKQIDAQRTEQSVDAYLRAKELMGLDIRKPNMGIRTNTNSGVINA